MKCNQFVIHTYLKRTTCFILQVPQSFTIKIKIRFDSIKIETVKLDFHKKWVLKLEVQIQAANKTMGQDYPIH